MLARLVSLRLRLLVAMVGTGLVALALAYVLVVHFQAGDDRAADQAKAKAIAEQLARRIARDQRDEPDDVNAEHLTAFQALLPNDQLVVERRGRRLYTGPGRRGQELEVTGRARFPGGSVTVRDHSGPRHGRPVTATVVGASVAIALILAAVIVATLLMRAVRGPLERAIVAADRVAAGDLSARMGTAGPEEFAHLGRAFDGMAQRLEDADREQRRFLADVAHEIATPINTVSGFALALADGTLADPGERAEATDLIAHDTARLRSLLDDLRSVTRVDLAETVRREPVDLAALCRRVAARFARDARAADVSLQVRARSATIVSDERLLETILSNLVANALRYTPAGGRVTLSLQRHRHESVVSVADTGIGIAPEHRGRVFDRLYRVDDARARDDGGSGLGLAISQRAAHALGGWIELTSELGKGSEFRLVLGLGRGGAPAAETSD